ncbi:MAG: RNA 2',3'-cyclic phosphodiesterase [Candidatus Sulfotelmatobacter sp.]
MRLFVALDIDDDIRNRIARFLDGVRGFAPDVRWARPESLHVTLKFIGEQSETQVEAIKRTLDKIEADHFELNFHGYGFFPSARAPRVFWVGVDEDSKLTSLAGSVDSKLIELNIEEERHTYNAHLTLGRIGGSGSPHREKGDRANRNFERLQEKLSALPVPEFGTMAAREFFLYQSQLSPGGSKYTKLAGFRLR